MAGMHVAVTCERVQDFAALGLRWRALEAQAGPHSFFQSWSWIGCLAEERYPDPVLLRAERDGATIGLALLNRRHGRLCLAESGDPVLDSPFIEHNAPLLARGAGPAVLEALLRAAWRVPGTRRLVLSGVPPALEAAAGGVALRHQERPAPYIDLTAIRGGGGDYLGSLSANARYQLRRSARHYAARGGLALQRAATVEEARRWLRALIDLHQRDWQGRGKPGAFAEPFMRRFHNALLDCAFPRGEVDLLRLDAGAAAIGYLYNFRLGGHVHAYQSGFDHGEAGPHGKPGLTSHQFAVERAMAEGDRVYDFMGGAARYKSSLANATTPLIWTQLLSVRSPLGWLARARRALGG